MTQRIFISQPMKGKTNEEIKAEINEIRKRIESDYTSYEIVDSFFENAPHDARPLWFLGKSLQLLSSADVAYFAKGWKDARGCKIEHECAKEYGIRVVDLDED